MSVRMLFAPKLKKHRRHPLPYRKRAMHPGMAARTERDHEPQDGTSRHAMMHGDRALGSSRRVAYAAAVTIALQHRFAQSTEVQLVLTFQRVAGGAQA